MDAAAFQQQRALLANHKFDAVASFLALQDLASGTHLASLLLPIEAMVSDLDFAQARAQLSQWVQPVTPVAP